MAILVHFNTPTRIQTQHLPTTTIKLNKCSTSITSINLFMAFLLFSPLDFFPVFEKVIHKTHEFILCVC